MNQEKQLLPTLYESAEHSIQTSGSVIHNTLHWKEKKKKKKKELDAAMVDPCNLSKRKHLPIFKQNLEARDTLT